MCFRVGLDLSTYFGLDSPETLLTSLLYVRVATCCNARYAVFIPGNSCMPTEVVSRRLRPLECILLTFLVTVSLVFIC